MFARDPAAAVEQLIGPAQRALSCVTASVLTGRRYHETDVLFFRQETNPAPLGRSSEWLLSVRHYYRLRRSTTERSAARWQITTAGYIYDLDDRHQAHVVGYHWHPIPESEIGYPHLHIGRQFAHAGLPEGVRDYADRLVRSHLPTGPIVLPTVVRLVIAEFGVEPLRADWGEVLDETEREASRTLLTK